LPLPAAMSTRTVKYVEWLTRRSRWVLAVGAAVAAISAYLTIWHLPLRADLAYLLPRDAPSVRDGEKLLARMPAKDTNLVLVVAPDPTITCAIAAFVVVPAIMALPRMKDLPSSDSSMALPQMS
jgi:peptidoglycan/LPS O-acetylase OafA/YrhL